MGSSRSERSWDTVSVGGNKTDSNVLPGLRSSSSSPRLPGACLALFIVEGARVDTSPPSTATVKEPREGGAIGLSLHLRMQDANAREPWEILVPTERPWHSPLTTSLKNPFPWAAPGTALVPIGPGMRWTPSSNTGHSGRSVVAHDQNSCNNFRALGIPSVGLETFAPNGGDRSNVELVHTPGTLGWSVIVCGAAG